MNPDREGRDFAEIGRWRRVSGNPTGRTVASRTVGMNVVLPDPV